MRSRDVIQLYDVVGPQARVTILNDPLAAMVPALAPVPGPGGTTAASSH
jgi:hypothetical protein